MFEKHLWKSDILSKDAGHWPASLVFFKHFASKTRLPGFYINGTLVENGLSNFSIKVFLFVFQWTTVGKLHKALKAD